MKALHNAAYAALVAVVLPCLWPVSAHSQAPVDPKFAKEMARQEAIYKAREDARDAGYTVDRGLADYTHALGNAFDRALAALGATDRWLDIGAGRAFAILDYYDAAPAQAPSRGKASAVAMSIEDRRGPRWEEAAKGVAAGKVNYVFNRRLRDYSPEELGKFQLITDMIGGFSYSNDLSLFIEKTLGFLEVNGSFFTVLQDVHLETGENLPHYKDSPYLTEIFGTDGMEVKICSWLKSISCVEVTCARTPRWTPPVENYHVRKVCNEVSVPPLEPVHYTAGTPPERRYKMKRGQSRPPAAAPTRTEASAK